MTYSKTSRHVVSVNRPPDYKDSGLPANLLQKIVDVPDETLLDAQERHPKAWEILTLPHHKEGMTTPDEYSPELTPRTRNNRTAAMSDSVRFVSKAEDSLGAILSRIALQVGHRQFSFELSGTPFPIPNMFDTEGRQVVYWPDAIVHGPVYGDGILRVQGGVHRTRKHQLRDPIQKEIMERQNFWVEDFTDAEARDARAVAERLEKHRREVIKFP